MSTREHAQGVVRVPGIRKHVLRAWRRSRGWAVPELARRLARVAQKENVPIARGGHDSLKRMIYQWEDENDKHVPGEHYQLLYVKAMGLRSLEDLLVGPPGYTGPTDSAWGFRCLLVSGQPPWGSRTSSWRSRRRSPPLTTPPPKSAGRWPH